jgi:hypothetical protein
MSIINILAAFPATFYFSIIAFIASIIVQLKNADSGFETISSDGANEQGEGSVNKKNILVDVSLAGVVAFGLLIVYFSWNIIADWRNSSGVFYPEDQISENSLPVIISNDLPSPPPEIAGQSK